MSWVRRVILTFACLAGLLLGSLGGAAAVAASGTSTSAGDQQYVDPLTGSSTTSHPTGSSNSGSSNSGSSGSSQSSGSSGSGSSSPTTNGTLSSTPPTSTSSSSGSSSDPGPSTGSHSGTLPFTGMNVWACVAIGVGLLGTGLVLRRIVRPH
jgi:hypothetical protein